MHVIKRFLGARVTQIVAARIGQAFLVVVGVTFLTFSLLNLLPGTTAAVLLGDGATQQEINDLEVSLHLNTPFFPRYLSWLGHALTGSFGNSLSGDQPISQILASRIPVTLELIVLAFILSLLFTIPVAMLAANKPGGIADKISMSVSMIGLSFPTFVLALLLILLFAVKLKLLPAIGYTPYYQSPGANLEGMILPAVTLAFPLFCHYTRILRADLVDQMATGDFILAARAKGLSPLRILGRHALRNSSFGLVTLVGLNLGTLIGGTVLVEDIFAIPGIGQELLLSITERDVVTVEAIVVVLAVAVVLANLVTDLLYAVIDPRVRTVQANG